MTELLPLNISPIRVKLRVEDYLLLDASGAFEPYRKIELIEGDVCFMNAQHRPHAYLKSELAFSLRIALGSIDSALYVMTEGTVAIPPHNAPEPDIILTGEPIGEGPIPSSTIALLVEVSDATLDQDLTRKAAIYARANVPEYWVADVNGRELHQMWIPQGDAYAERRTIAFGASVAAATIDGLAIETTTL